MINPVKNKCLFLSEIIYRLFRLVDRRGDYKINVVVTFYPSGDRGHAWVTRNGHDFLLPNPTIVMSSLSVVGENTKYRYYVKDRNVGRWFDKGII